LLFKGYGAKVGLGNMRVKAENRMVTQLKIENKELAQIERLIDNNNYTEIEYIVYNLYGLTQDEINYINSL